MDCNKKFCYLSFFFLHQYHFVGILVLYPECNCIVCILLPKHVAKLIPSFQDTATGQTGHHVQPTVKELALGAGSATTHHPLPATPLVLETSRQKQRSVELTDVLDSLIGLIGRSVVRSVGMEPEIELESVITHPRRLEVLSVRVLVSRLRSATSRSVLSEVSRKVCFKVSISMEILSLVYPLLL